MAKTSEYPTDTTPLLTDKVLGVSDPAGTPATVLFNVGDLLDALIFSNYTPAISQNGARTTSSLSGRYVQVGKLVIAYGNAVVSNAGTAGHSVRATVPVTAAAAAVGQVVGSGWILDAGTAAYASSLRLLNDTTLEFYTGANTSGNPVGVGPSFALANTDQIFWQVVYEAD